MGLNAIIFLLVSMFMTGIIVLFVGIYYQLVLVNATLDKAWTNIDILLTQITDDSAVLIALCQQYIEPENDILKKVAQANARTGMSTFPGKPHGHTQNSRRPLKHYLLVLRNSLALRHTSNSY